MQRLRQPEWCSGIGGNKAGSRVHRFKIMELVEESASSKAKRSSLSHGLPGTIRRAL